MIVYRIADMADLEQVVRQRLRFIEDARPDLDSEAVLAYQGPVRDYYSQTIPSGECVYCLAWDADRVVGGGGYALRRYAPGLMLMYGTSGYVFNIFVEPSHRRRGIARGVVTQLMDQARRRGLARLDLHAMEAGRPLYEQLGFRPPEHVYLEWSVFGTEK